MKPRNFFIELFYWGTFLPFLLLTVSHYQVVFLEREVPSSLAYIASWGIGLSFDGLYANFNWIFPRISGIPKYFYLSALIVIVFFLQYKYYAITEPVLLDRVIFSAIFPVMLSLYAFLGNKKQEAKDNGGNQGNYSDDPDIRMLQEMGIDIGKPAAKLTAPVDTGGAPVPKSIRKSKGARLITFDDGSVQCPICGLKAASAQAIKPVHNLQECIRGRDKITGEVNGGN